MNDSEQFEIFLTKEDLKGLTLGQFECAWHWMPPVSSNFKVGRTPFSPNWPSGVIRMGSQYESGKVGMIVTKEDLKGLHLGQFECARHWMPPVSSNVKVGRIPFSPN